MQEEKIYANALNQSLQLGPAKLAKIKNHFKSFKNGWTAPAAELGQITGTKDFREFRKNINPEKEFETLKKEKINILLKEDLPFLLRQIPCPPEILYLKGRLPEENKNHVAFVGTRKCSPYGKEACKKIISGLKNYGVIVVSGLAAGIDTVSHKTALSNGMGTIAVLGSGIKNSVIYPQINQGLAREIEEGGGCVATEFPYNMKATRFTFPQRNRIVAGLSRATAVIEAPERSGALITAFMALDYDRDVLSLPGPVFSANSQGTNNLLKLGAIPLTSAGDILKILGIEEPEKPESAQLSPEEIKIISLLFEPLSRDEIIQNSQIAAKEISPLLTQMEIKGIIKEIGGFFYKI